MEGGWDERKIRSYFNDAQDIEDILKIYIPNNTCEDKKFGLS